MRSGAGHGAGGRQPGEAQAAKGVRIPSRFPCATPVPSETTPGFSLMDGAEAAYNTVSYCPLSDINT